MPMDKGADVKGAMKGMPMPQTPKAPAAPPTPRR